MRQINVELKNDLTSVIWICYNNDIQCQLQKSIQLKLKNNLSLKLLSIINSRLCMPIEWKLNMMTLKN